MGLVPATDQSGTRDPQRRISKEGDAREAHGRQRLLHLGTFGSDSDLTADCSKDAPGIVEA